MNRKIALVMMYAEEMRGNQEEIGMGSISSFLRRNGYSVTMIAEQRVDLVVQKLQSIDWLMIGFTVYESNKKIVFQTAAEIKRILRNTIIFAGGIYPSYAGKELLAECADFDYSVCGEGEKTCLQLADCSYQGVSTDHIRGIVFRSNGKVIQNPRQSEISDLDSLAFPARDILVQNHAKVAQVSTSRGCYAACSFCAKQIVFPRYRSRSVQSIADELEYLVLQHQVKAINFIDASFEDGHHSSQRLMHLSQEIIRRRLDIFFYVQLRAEFYRDATPALISTLKQAGLCSACVGIESGNAEDLELYNKISTLEDNEKIVGFLRENRINIEPGFINFNPYSTLDRLRQNVDYLQRHVFACNIEYLVIACSIYKGTSLYDKAFHDQLINPEKKAGYRFLDRKVDTLYEYTSGYIKNNQDNEMTNLFKTTNMYATRMMSVLMCYEHMYKKKGLVRELKVYEQYRDRHFKICVRFNDLAAKWFKGLIYLAETNWNNDEADDLSNKYLSKQAVQRVLKDFISSKNTFVKQLLALDMKNAMYLLDYLST